MNHDAYRHAFSNGRFAIIEASNCINESAMRRKRDKSEVLLSDRRNKSMNRRIRTRCINYSNHRRRPSMKGHLGRFALHIFFLPDSSFSFLLSHTTTNQRNSRLQRRQRDVQSSSFWEQKSDLRRRFPMDWATIPTSDANQGSQTFTSTTEDFLWEDIDSTAYSVYIPSTGMSKSNPLEASAYILRAQLRRWKRRLITREDAKHLHKITGMLFVLSSFGLMGYGVVDLLSHGWTRSVTSHGKPFVALLFLMLSSTLAQASSSISLAKNHRKTQPAVRNTFMCNAIVAILGSVCALWVSPWYPSCLNGAFSRGFYLITNTLGLVGMADNAVRLKGLIASRQIHNKHNTVNLTGSAYWKDALTYMMPIWIGLPFFLGMLYLFGIAHDRTFYLQLLQRPGHPHLHGGAVYANIMVAMGASYSSLVVTLRDKKLIGKATEMGSLTAIMLAVAGSLYQSLRDPGTISMFFGL